jgi:hypothetical protein
MCLAYCLFGGVLLDRNFFGYKSYNVGFPAPHYFPCPSALTLYGRRLAQALQNHSGVPYLSSHPPIGFNIFP